MVAFENSKTNLLVLPRCFMFKIIGPSEILTKIKNILTHWSVAQAGLIDEENWRQKISLDCPFKESFRIYSNRLSS